MSYEDAGLSLQYWKQFYEDNDQTPGHTPFETIEALHNVCAVDDMTTFQHVFDKWTGLGVSIQELGPIMLLAAHRNNTEATSLFISHGAKIEHRDVINAIASKAKDVLTLFLQNGWDINWNPGLATVNAALASAVTDEDMTRWMLEHGTDPNARSESGVDLTPLSEAAEYASLSTIKLLFEYGADVHKGEPLYYAARRTSEITEVLDYLLDQGADLSAEVYQNHPHSVMVHGPFAMGTPLHHAAVSGNTEAVRFLLSRGADPTVKDRWRRSVMDCAKMGAQPGSTEVMEVLKSAMEQST